MLTREHVPGRRRGPGENDGRRCGELTCDRGVRGPSLYTLVTTLYRLLQFTLSGNSAGVLSGVSRAAEPERGGPFTLHCARVTETRETSEHLSYSRSRSYLGVY